MLQTQREKAICEKYSKRDSAGKVSCWMCPLRKNDIPQCKANSHYNRHTKEWEYDE